MRAAVAMGQDIRVGLEDTTVLPTVPLRRATATW